MSTRRWLLVILSFATALGVSAWVVISSWPHGGSTRSLPLAAHLLALTLSLVDIVARAVKLHWSARSIGCRLPMRPALRATIGGDFGGAITPSRSGTEPARFLLLSEAKLGAGNAVVVIFTELALEIAGLVVLALALALILPRGGLALTGFIGVVLGFVALLAGGIVLALAISRERDEDDPPRWARMLRISDARWMRLRRPLRELHERLRVLRRLHPGWAAAALVMTIVHVAARVAILPVLVRTAAPEASLRPLIIWPLTLYYGAGSAPAPGGGGVVEVAFRAALGGVIPLAYMGASLIWWRFYSFYFPMLLGAVATGRAVTRALRDRPAASSGSSEAVST